MSRSDLQFHAQRFDLHLTDDALAAFESHRSALYIHNDLKNLTRVPESECWSRHYLDSLAVSPLIPDGASVIDIGTGPGFPAWPLALARPDCQVHAVDSNAKMLAFLETAPLPNLTVQCGRVEELSDLRASFDIATGRAIAPLAIQLELSAPLVRLGGWVLPFRSLSEEFDRAEYKQLGLRLRGVTEYTLPHDGVTRAIPRYEKVSPTPNRFPRPWAVLRRDPLVQAPAKTS